jgi:hypothetical protein
VGASATASATATVRTRAVELRTPRVDGAETAATTTASTMAHAEDLLGHRERLRVLSHATCVGWTVEHNERKRDGTVREHNERKRRQSSG